MPQRWPPNAVPAMAITMLLQLFAMMKVLDRVVEVDVREG
jgi:hypothetical protein